jgi:hypothetical protein
LLPVHSLTLRNSIYQLRNMHPYNVIQNWCLCSTNTLPHNKNLRRKARINSYRVLLAPTLPKNRTINHIKDWSSTLISKVETYLQPLKLVKENMT